MEERVEITQGGRSVTRWLVLGILLGAAVTFWLLRKDEERRKDLIKRAQQLKEQAAGLQTITVDRAQQVQDRALNLQAEVSAEVERGLREGKETLEEMLARVRGEVQALQKRALKLADDAQLQAQLARKKAELRALEARKRLRNLRG
ncbi:MAG: hypothetical protein GXO55_02565 [Chloroflexi bacterium]|nr:hypothetical protein [Chloroflexota bacterium]